MNVSNAQEDKFLKELFHEGTAQPVSDITQKVMHRIEETSKVFEYSPIIGKKIWILLGSMFLILQVYLILQIDQAFQLPVTLAPINDFLSLLDNSYSLELNYSIPAISPVILIAMIALNILGVYFIVSYQWSRGMFKK